MTDQEIERSRYRLEAEYGAQDRRKRRMDSAYGFRSNAYDAANKIYSEEVGRIQEDYEAEMGAIQSLTKD